MTPEIGFEMTYSEASAWLGPEVEAWAPQPGGKAFPGDKQLTFCPSRVIK
jgi:hypothetical protein